MILIQAIAMSALALFLGVFAGHCAGKILGAKDKPARCDWWKLLIQAVACALLLSGLLALDQIIDLLKQINQSL